jgi:hypothetical protein
MSVIEEIKRRLRVSDYIRISKALFVNKTFETLENNEYLSVLKIADKYGSKYKRFCKLKDGCDIRTITSNLNLIEYSYNNTPHSNLKIINVYKTDTSFDICTEFYTREEIWSDTIEENGKKYRELHTKQVRRIMYLEKRANSNCLIVSIDPIGEGTNAYQRINSNLEELTSLLGINIMDFFDITEIENPIYQLITNNELIPSKIIANDSTTKRIKSVYSQTSRDNIKDDDIYINCTQNNLKLDNIKMKFRRESMELFGTTLLKIITNADSEATDEFTQKLIPLL